MSFEGGGNGEYLVKRNKEILLLINHLHNQEILNEGIKVLEDHIGHIHEQYKDVLKSIEIGNYMEAIAYNLEAYVQFDEIKNMIKEQHEKIKIGNQYAPLRKALLDDPYIDSHRGSPLDTYLDILRKEIRFKKLEQNMKNQAFLNFKSDRRN